MAFKEATFFLSALFLLAFAASQTQSSSVDACKVLVIRTKLMFYNTTRNITFCCTNWCSSYCSGMETVTLNRTVYFQDYDCCPGYGGPECLPVCSNNSCSGPNKACLLPEQCGCVSGWTGDNCQRVDGLHLVSITDTSAQLKWSSPSNNNTNGYLSLCSNSTHSLNASIAPGNNGSTITDLHPYSVYSCCVVPLLKQGNGTESCVTVQTQQRAPASPPLNIRTETISSTTLLVRWDPPSEPNGLIKNYTLFVNYGNQGSTDTLITVDGQLGLYLLDRLTSGQILRIRIAATTDGGEGPVSNYVTASVAQISTPVTESFDINTNLLSVTKNQAATTSLVWTPPNDSNGIKYYHLTLHLAPEGRAMKEWTVHPTQIFNISIALEPYKPYRLDAVSMTTAKTTGLVSRNVFFAVEGSPSISPRILNASREGPTIGRIYWSGLSLVDSRGIIDNYTISYSQSSSNETCGDVANTKSIVFGGGDEGQPQSRPLSNLDIQTPYCIKILASTGSGSGPYSPSILLPTYASSQVCLLLNGVYNCSKWILEDLNEKLNNASTALVNSLNKACSCGITTRHLLQSSFMCSLMEDLAKSVKYCTRVIGTSEVESRELVEYLIRTLRKESLLISGLNLSVANVCDSEDCFPPPSEGEPVDDGAMFFRVVSVILAIVLTLSLLMQVFTCILLANYCNKYYTKKSRQSSHLPVCIYQSSTTSEASSDDKMSTTTNTTIEKIRMPLYNTTV